MVTQEIINLHEAYASIYTSEEEHQETQELTEEVLIASQYFCEMGLNEDGIEILIEELGLDQFVDFVYHIAEEYYLTEARARGEKIEPKLSSGKPIQGKPKAASLKSLRKKKVARKEAEEKASEAKPSGLKASLKRQSAIAAASKKQPKKPGLLDRVAGAVSKGIERHNQANKNLNKNLSKASKVASEVGGLLGNVGRRVGGVAKEFGSGASGTAKLAGRVASKGLGEEVEEWVNALVEEGYDMSEYTWDDMTEMYTLNSIIDYLISERYADTLDNALVIMANMGEEWKESICEEILNEKNDEGPHPSMSQLDKEESARREQSGSASETLEQRIKRRAAEQRARGYGRRRY